MMKLTEGLSLIAAIIAIGGAAMWVHGVNERLAKLESIADLGIGAKIAAGSENLAVQTTTGILNTGQSVLQKLCFDVGTSLRRANDKDDSDLTRVSGLERQFRDLGCNEAIAK